MADSGSYIYAAGRHVGDLGGVRGLRDAPLRVVSRGDLDAIVSTVDLQEFGEAPLRQHLEDLGWLEEVARVHDRVVRAAWTATGAVAPFRLATICTTDEAVRGRLTALYDELTAALDRVAGRSEWTVKAFFAGQPDPAEAGDVTTGTAYLMRRRQQVDRQHQAAVDAQAVADDIHRRLAGSADACRRLPPQDRRLTGYAEPMILNGAYLVDDREPDSFRLTVEELAVSRPGVRLTLDGPWPPYSFTSLESA
ncbi:GvpL/GvpF family gas vesicle protein [Kribbella sp.]|uniref:GvpL/GvpF family gas vesicle protein n=1 Tax=Kribbella sp. TaxID=1871183 RepID=UPI002D65484E|nr:GvpL/GvpF family gas vesicle protein [Kribbella sp.]HZX05776.1 GvpL/GvpF family gas vesicle protein [Kribbella sp.]